MVGFGEQDVFHQSSFLWIEGKNRFLIASCEQYCRKISGHYIQPGHIQCFTFKKHIYHYLIIFEFSKKKIGKKTHLFGLSGAKVVSLQSFPNQMNAISIIPPNEGAYKKSGNFEMIHILAEGICFSDCNYYGI